MAGQVRPLDRRIRLSEPVAIKVDYLARLAGVRLDEIVNFVLGEVLTEEAGFVLPSRPSATRQRGPAAVIPIDRRGQAAAPAIAGEVAPSAGVTPPEAGSR